MIFIAIAAGHLLKLNIQGNKMINLSGKVFTWFKQQQNTPKLFAAASEKRRKISIHEIINLNASQKATHEYKDVNNTISLLKLATKRGANPLTYCVDLSLRRFNNPHHNTARRIVSRWRHANGVKNG